MSVTVQAIPHEPSTASLKNVKEFYVPNILAFSLKKTAEERLQTAETDAPSSLQNGGIIPEEDEDLKMSPRRKSLKSTQQTSSFLLEPFLKPVAHHIESNKENPVLKALFGGRSPPGLSPWTCVTRTPINNCHPFKKTEFSHDLNSDDTPVQIPKSLIKKPSTGPPAKSENPEPKPTVLKEVHVNSSLSATIASELSFTKSSTLNVQPQSPTRTCPEKEKDLTELSIFNKRKKILSQSTLSPPRPRTQYVNSERLIQLRSIVDNAIKSHKVYSMTGCYNSVRNALKQRGWIEKIDNDVKGRRKVNRYEEIGLYFLENLVRPEQDLLNTISSLSRMVTWSPTTATSPLSCRLEVGDGLIAVKYQTVAAMRLSMQTNSGFAHSDQIRYTGQGEAEIINKMLKNVTEDLCWLSRPYPYYCWKDFDKFEMVNRLPRAYFSNKVGLCNSLQQIQWFYETGVCSTQYPRTYNMSTKDEVEAFKDDFRLTACIGMLKWFLHTYKTAGEKGVRSPDGKVDMNVIEFALRRCAEFVKTKRHEDIDILETPTVWEYQWDQFITQYYRIINEGQILKDNKEGVAIKAVVSNVQSMLNILKPYWPQFDIEGYQNFWIVKPGGRCCGAGIVIKNNLEHILVMVNPNSMRETRFVVQKYIERPLLIYNTKFDIRQWFLVTNVYPLTIWMYKECYLRFCSQPFTLKNTHESIHLCNNAIQRKYKNGKRDRGLPDENMWDCYTFQTYLKAIGHPDAWEKHIYPGMREGFIGALLASQDSMERKKNCFELYGADFMISDNLTDGPWLIEINSNPAMDSSTSVTARLCPQVLEDIIKVVIDRRDNKSASTGAFEMVFRQNCPPIPPYLGMSLCVKGKKAYRSAGDFRSKKSKIKKPCESLHYIDTEEESTVEEIISVTDSPKNPETPKKEVNSADEENIAKVLSSETAKERGSKRRKIDWVRKNIEDLKSICSMKQSKTVQPIISDKSSPRKKLPPNAEELFREQVLKLLETVEMNEFIKEVVKMKKQKDETTKKSSAEIEDLTIERIEIMKRNTNNSLQDIIVEFGIPEKAQETLSKLIQLSRHRAEGDEMQWYAAFKEFDEKCGLISKFSAKSCPNFDLAFEKELQNVEEKEKTGKTKSEESFDSYFSAQTHMSTSNSKTSLDYFRDWKSKLHETRKTCEDLLAELHLFKEANSKVKFQEAVKKRMKDEIDFVKRIRQRKKCKGRPKIKKEEKDYFEEKEKPKQEDCPLTSKVWDADLNLAPLAINSENGAVRNINYSLPKIKQRSRPLLPNGSSGHGRKIDVALQQTCYH